MKKGDKFFAEGNRRSFYSAGYTPVTEGEVVSVTKDYIEVLWEGSSAPIKIEKTRFDERNKKHRNKSLFKVGRKQDVRI